MRSALIKMSMASLLLGSASATPQDGPGSWTATWCANSICKICNDCPDCSLICNFFGLPNCPSVDDDGCFTPSGVQSASACEEIAADLNNAALGGGTVNSRKEYVHTIWDYSVRQSVGGCSSGSCQSGSQGSVQGGPRSPFVLEVKRTFLSRLWQPDTAFGKQWKHNYAYVLQVNEAPDWIEADITFPEDSYATWRYIDIDKTGQFVSRDGQEQSATFTKLGAEEYLLETDLGSKFHFILLEDDAWGRYGVDWIENPNGFRLTMEYDTIPDGSARLLKVTDSYGRTLEYDWGWLAGQGHIVTKVTAPDGREIHYTYSSPYDYTVSYPNGDVSSYSLETDHFGDYFAFNDALGASHSRKHRAYMGENNLCRGVRAIDGSWILVPDFVPGSTDSIVYRYASGREETYTLNAEGRPISMVNNGTGATKSFTWDYKGFPLSVTNYAGETTSYEYDAQNRLVKQTNPDGSFRTHTWSGDRIIATTNENGDTIASEYDAAGNRTKVTYPDGSTELRSFNPFGLVTSYTDRNGQTTWFEYDAYGFLAKKTLPKLSSETSAPFWTYEHDINGRRLSATDPVGRVTRWAYDAVDRIVMVTYPDGSTEEIQYGNNSSDPNDPAGTTGQVVARKDRNDHWTHYTYDTLDNVLTQTDPIGVVKENTYLPGTTLVLTKRRTGDLTVHQYDGNGWLASSSRQADRDTWLTTAYERDPAGRVTKVTDHYGFETMTTYDAAGRIETLSQQILGTDLAVTTYEYDGLGQEIRRTDPNGNDWIREYDHNARLVRLLTPVGGEMLYSYDAVGNRTAVSQLVQGAQYRTKTNTYNARNQLATTTDPAGNVITNTYHPDDRLASVANAGTGGYQTYQYACCGRMTEMTTYVDGGPGDIVERYKYDGNGNVITRIDGEGYSWKTRYDARNRIVMEIDPLQKRTTTTYYEDGSSRDKRLEPGQGSIIVRTDANGNVEATLMDGAGRVLRMLDGALQSTVYAYDLPNPDGTVGVQKTDRNQVVTREDFDGAGRLRKQVDGLGLVTTMQYDASGNLVLTTDASGNSTRYFYDAAHRKIRVEFPGHQSGVDRDAIDYSYLLTDQMESRTDQNGDTVLYGYDAAGRQISLTYPDNSQDTFGYDIAGRLISASAGQYATGFPLTRTYDPANRLIEEVQSGRSVQYTYDRRHWKTTIQDSAGTVTTRTYTARGELDEVRGLGTTYADYSYDAAGRQTGKALGNGTQTEMRYDVRNRTTRVTHKRGTQDLQSLAYAYDAVGNKLLEENLTFPARSQAFAYDDADRLIDWARGVPAGTASLTQAWVLDPLANWTTITVNGVPELRVHNASNELRSRGSTNFEYDANGNLTHDGTYVYEWDYNNRLQRVVLAADNSPINEFAYDALGRRVQRVDAVATETTEYVYDDEQVIEEYAPGPLRIASMAYGAYIDEPIVRRNSAGDLFYYHTNALFSPVALTDQAGAVVERYEYDAYGTVQTYDAAWSNPQAASRVGSPVTLTGRRLDPETGLLYFRARHYSPDQGRFIGRDPFGYVDGANLYRAYFVPMTTDPTGLWCFDECSQEGDRQFVHEDADAWKMNPNGNSPIQSQTGGVHIWIKGKCETCEEQCCGWFWLDTELRWDDPDSMWYSVNKSRPGANFSGGYTWQKSDYVAADWNFAKDLIEERCEAGTLSEFNF